MAQSNEIYTAEQILRAAGYFQRFHEQASWNAKAQEAI
jgi:hypothetical protein